MKDFNEIWENVAEGISKEELLKVGVDEKQVDIAISLEKLSRDGEINLTTSEIDNMSFDKAKSLIVDVVKNSSDQKLLNEVVRDSSDNQILIKIAENPNTSDKTLDKQIDKTNNGILLKAIVEHPNASEDTLDKVFEKVDDGQVLTGKKIDDKKILKAIAEHPNASEDTLDKVFEKVANRVDPNQVLKAIAEHPNASEDTLDKVFEKAYSMDPIIAVAGNFNTSEDTLLNIAEYAINERNNEEKYENLLREIAENPNTNVYTLDTIADKTNDKDVLEAVIANKNTSIETLVKIAETTYSEEILDKLSKHENESVVGSVTKNENASPETLKNIADEMGNFDKLFKKELEAEFQDSLKAMKDGMSLQEVYSETPNKEVADLIKDLENVNFNFKAPIDSIEKGKEIVSETREFELNLAKSSKDSDVIDNLSRSTDENVLKAISNNSNTSDETKEKLIDREDVSSAVKFNIADKTDNPELLDKIADKNNDLLNLAVAENPATSEKTLDKIVEKTDDLIVLDSVVKHDNVSNETLIKLAENSDKDISEASLDKLESRVELSKQIESDSNRSTDSEKGSEKSEDKQADVEKQSSGSKMKM